MDLKISNKIHCVTPKKAFTDNDIFFFPDFVMPLMVTFICPVWCQIYFDSSLP